MLPIGSGVVERWQKTCTYGETTICSSGKPGLDIVMVGFIGVLPP